MSEDHYYVENNLFGIVGGSFNTVYNWITVGQSMFESAGLSDLVNNIGQPAFQNARLAAPEAQLSNGIYYILLLEILSKHLEPLSDNVQKAVQNGGNPMRVNITQLVSDCAHGVYFNKGNDESIVWRIANSLLSFICCCRGLDFDVKVAKVLNDYYYELYPRK